MSIPQKHLSNPFLSCLDIGENDPSGAGCNLGKQAYWTLTVTENVAVLTGATPFSQERW
jgi:hypothetical protein